MNPRPIAIGYLRTDISGSNQQWDESRMRTLAARFGYRLLKTVAFSDRTVDPVERLATVIDKLGVEAVFVPGPNHFDERQIPAQIVRLADVVTVDPENTYARTATGGLPELNGAPR